MLFQDYSHFYGQGAGPGPAKKCPLWSDTKTLHKKERTTSHLFIYSFIFQLENVSAENSEHFMQTLVYTDVETTQKLGIPTKSINKIVKSSCFQLKKGVYYMAKKWLPISYSNLLCKLGNYFLDMVQ